MAIKNRQGKSQDFVPTKLVSGEFAVVQEGDENTADGSALYLATKAGSVKRIPFATEVEDLKTQVEEVVEDAEEAISNAIDPTLTQSGKAADAKNTGDEIANLKSDLKKIKPLSEEVKQALLACFRNVPGLSNTDYYANLEDALYSDGNLTRIEATFNQGSFVVYESTPLNELKAYLTVTGYYTDGTSGIITDYALSGTLSVGTSTITVTAGGKSTTFTVTVSTPEWDYVWNAGDGIPTFLSDPDNFEHTAFTSEGYITGTSMSVTNFTITPISEGGDQVIEVEFMINNSTIGTGYQISVLTGTGQGGKLLSNGNTEVKVNKTEYSAQIASNTWNTARVEVRNGKISYYLNDSPIAENIVGYEDSYIGEFLQITKTDCFTRAIRVKVL